MIDSATLSFKPFTDPRSETNQGFSEGLSGPLLIATAKCNSQVTISKYNSFCNMGRKYIIKFSYHHNAANELVGCWLGYMLGAPTPHAYLLKPSKKFEHKYGVAISFIDSLKPLDPTNLSDQMKEDICAQFALNILISTDDNVQMSTSDGRIYSMDFSEAFYVSDSRMLDLFLLSENLGFTWAENKLKSFRIYQASLSFDTVCEFATELNLDPLEMKDGTIAAAKKILDISEDEIIRLSDELSNMYPVGYAVYYEECIHAMQEKMKAF